MDPIYLDNNATTRLDEAVLEAMLPFLRGSYGNPSSRHPLGEEASAAVEAARRSVARLAGAHAPRAVVFTSGGTEALNSAVAAAAARAGARGAARVLTSTVEHSALSAPLASRADLDVVAIGVDGEGRLDREGLLDELERAGDGLAFVALQAANSETGVRTPPRLLAEVAARAHAVGAALVLDAVQVPGKAPLDVRAIGADFTALSAHKLHGPKGVGALVLGPGTGDPAPLLRGGPQEGGWRAGTPNVPGIVGFGRAAELARAATADPEGPPGLFALRERLEAGLARVWPGSRVLGRGAPRLPNTTSALLAGVDAELLLAYLADAGVAASAGSACNAGRRRPSAVLLAMGLAEEDARSVVRLSLSRHTTQAEVDGALATLGRARADLA